MSSSLALSTDQVKLFHLYALFGGNAARAAAVARVPKEEIEALAHDHQWKDKLTHRNRLDTDEGKESEREVNRVANYYTADQLSKVFESIIADLNSDPEFARAFCTEIGEEGEKSFNTKNLVELAKGLQIIADMKYRALGDKMAQGADAGNSMGKTTNIVLNVYDALSKRFDRMPPAVEATTRIVQAVAEAHNGPTEN